MKKYTGILLVLLLACSALAGCGSSGETASEAAAESTVFGESGDGPQIVTTIFPEYDWVREILGENPAGAQITMLLDNGVDLHSFQPTAKDIMKISSCDLFIYVGGASDAWVEDALKSAQNPDRKVIKLLDVLGDQVKEEELVEGMEEEAEEEGEEGPEYDEHVWLSLKNTQVLCDAIEEAIASIDPDHADVYETNNASYQGKLQTMDGKYREMVDAAPVKTLLFGDRFPFRYLTDDYGLEYFAAFTGCSAETEASFETVSFLASKVDELGLTSVVTIEGTDHRLAETIVQNTAGKNQEILTLDSMQAVTAADTEAGVTYLDIMEKNREVLEKALGAES